MNYNACEHWFPLTPVETSRDVQVFSILDVYLFLKLRFVIKLSASVRWVLFTRTRKYHVVPTRVYSIGERTRVVFHLEKLCFSIQVNMRKTCWADSGIVTNAYLASPIMILRSQGHSFLRTQYHDGTREVWSFSVVHLLKCGQMLGVAWNEFVCAGHCKTFSGSSLCWS